MTHDFLGDFAQGALLALFSRAIPCHVDLFLDAKNAVLHDDGRLALFDEPAQLLDGPCLDRARGGQRLELVLPLEIDRRGGARRRGHFPRFLLNPFELLDLLELRRRLHGRARRHPMRGFRGFFQFLGFHLSAVNRAAKLVTCHDRPRLSRRDFRPPTFVGGREHLESLLDRQ